MLSSNLNRGGGISVGDSYPQDTPEMIIEPVGAEQTLEPSGNDENAQQQEQTPTMTFPEFCKMAHDEFYKRQDSTPIPPQIWRRLRYNLPVSIGEMNIVPQGVEQLPRGGRGVFRSNRCVVQLGHDSEEHVKYMQDVITYVLSLLEYLNSQTAITYARFVKTGTTVVQLVLELDQDTHMTGQLVAALTEAGFPSFLIDPQPAWASATLCFQDVGSVLNSGDGISEQNIIELLALGSSSDLRVIPGYEDGVWYALLKSSEVVWAWMMNTPLAGYLQQKLFKEFKVLISIQYCENELSKVSRTKHADAKAAAATEMHSVKGAPVGSSVESSRKVSVLEGAQFGGDDLFEDLIQSSVKNVKIRQGAVPSLHEDEADASLSLFGTGGVSLNDSAGGSVQLVSDAKTNPKEPTNGSHSTGNASSSHPPPYATPQEASQPSHIVDLSKVFHHLQYGSQQVQQDVPTLVDDENTGVTASAPLLPQPPHQQDSYASRGVLNQQQQQEVTLSWDFGSSAGSVLPPPSSTGILGNTSILGHLPGFVPPPSVMPQYGMLPKGTTGAPPHGYNFQQHSTTAPSSGSGMLSIEAVRAQEFVNELEGIMRKDGPHGKLMMSLIQTKGSNISSRVARDTLDRVAQCIVSSSSSDQDGMKEDLLGVLLGHIQGLAFLVKLIGSDVMQTLLQHRIWEFCDNYRVIQFIKTLLSKSTQTDDGSSSSQFIVSALGDVASIADGLDKIPASKLTPETVNTLQSGLKDLLCSLSEDQLFQVQASMDPDRVVSLFSRTLEAKHRNISTRVLLASLLTSGVVVHGSFIAEVAAGSNEHFELLIDSLTQPNDTKSKTRGPTVQGVAVRSQASFIMHLLDQFDSSLERVQKLVATITHFELIEEVVTAMNDRERFNPSADVVAVVMKRHAMLKSEFAARQVQSDTNADDQAAPAVPAVSSGGGGFRMIQKQSSSAMKRPRDDAGDNSGESSSKAQKLQSADRIFVGGLENYPQDPTEAPFPVLGAAWSAQLSKSYGYYYFSNSETKKATYKHPDTKLEYKGSPQAFFAAEEGLSQKEFVQRAKTMGITGISESDLQQWMGDQSARDETIDNAVLRILGIKYKQKSSTTTKEGDKSSAQKKHKTSGDQEKTRTPVISTEEKLRKFFSHYPTKGHPFPPLPRNWTCNLSASHGLYYFKPPSGNPTYRHPDTGMEYKPSPQAFAFHKKLTAQSVFAKANGKGAAIPLRACENWLNNQKMRIAAIDNAIIADCGIVYRSA